MTRSNNHAAAAETDYIDDPKAYDNNKTTNQKRDVFSIYRQISDEGIGANNVERRDAEDLLLIVNIRQLEDFAGDRNGRIHLL